MTPKDLDYIRKEVDNNTVVIDKKFFVSNRFVHDLLDEMMQESYIVVPDYVFNFYWRQDKKGYNFRTNPDYTLKLMLGPSAVTSDNKDKDLSEVLSWVRKNPSKYVDVVKHGCIREVD